ncbi:MAG TPA: dicarboxylate/amino acid:cation symporter [Cyclobacteriaceae bacterium]|nr:dicarboxylate/amino acid:cation symporter [Cyclobacteriaceae bacterium]HMV08241.1 dicarboxylate/amino acid:cation symporter [Cyclobacteriaceae bacterium]HMV90984.1 dicarboxylate/amino acid:cation symporter [Cyclobacteriaceae bacterium]HMX02084.1 dicarboxylate/amino acid:cation symporter [Cyclobacteriaceae bacterium]HMX49940.1 dicarboxylate/amino acid:cation symporter [Cyclobacteriaceae bacterium]
MESTIKPKKKSRLTLYIIIGLFVGIATGFILNKNYVDGENARLEALDTRLKEIKAAQHSTTDSLALVSLEADKKAVNEERNAVLEARDKKTEPFSILADVFLRLIKMIVAPLVFTTLVVGVAKLGDISAVGRIGGKTLLWFVGASLLSLLLGMIMVNIFEPGIAMHLPVPDTGESSGIANVAFSLKNFLYHIFPASVIESMAKNEILQIVVFSLFFGVATAAIGEQGKIIINFMDAAAHVILKITGYVMNLAPVAVFGAMAAIIAKQGMGILKTYSIFIGEFYFSLALLWGCLGLAAFIVIGKRVVNLVKRIKEPILLAFSTASSEAAFPKTMEELQRFGAKDKIVSFVLPLGYSFNLDGSMMYMTFASLFIAQSYGIHLPIATQISMLLVLMLTSKGIAGVPRASLVVIAGTLATFNIPEAGLALLLGIDPLLDMGRSATNVLGNSIATAVVSKWENALEPEVAGE